MTVTFLGGNGTVSIELYIFWMQITTSFVWQRLKYSHQLALVCAWYEFATRCEQSPWEGCELMLTNAYLEVDLRA